MTNTIDRTDFIAHDTELGRLYGLNAQAANRYTSAQYSLSWDEEHGRDTAAAEDAVRGALVVLNATIAAIRTHEESYTGWSRFFLVTNTMGRVNSGRRWRYAERIGCDSVDGTFLRWPTTNLPRLRTWINASDQLDLFAEAAA